MKKSRAMILAVLLCSSPCLSQGNQGAGTINKPASNVAVQIGGQDASFNLKALRVDGNGNLMAANVPKQENVALATANAASGVQAVYGGGYVFNQTCTGYNGGALNLRYRGPDGSTMIVMLGKVASDTSGGTLISLGSNAVVDVALPSGSTGCNANLARVS